MELIIKETGRMKKETYKQEPVFTIENSTLISCELNGCTAITIPADVKTIGKMCFASADVEEVILPEGIKCIESKAFADCFNLKKINFPEGLETVKDRTFMNCGSLVEVILPTTLTKIGDYAFYNAGIKQLTLPDPKNVLSTGISVFSAIKVKSINVPKNLRLNKAMFSNCQQLRTVNFEADWVTIPERCFYYCTSLEKIDISKALFIKDAAFLECYSLSVNVIPAYTCVSACSFMKTGVKDVTIEDISKVGEKAFSDCKSLKKLTINVADGPTSVPSALVKGCENLQTVMFTGRTQNLTVIEAAAFKETKNLNTVSLPDTIKTISKEAFYHSAIQNIHLPENLKQIGIMAFAGNGLKNIVIPNKTKRLGYYAFRNCKELTEVTLPESVTKIPSGIFEGCCSLKTVNAPNVDTVCDYAFYDCKNLEAFDFSKLQSLEHMAFAYTGIHEAIFSDRLVNLGTVIFLSCNNLQTVDMKACKIQKIPYQCFCFCEGLKDVQLPQDVIAFGNGCFLRAKLNKLTINAGTYVDDNAFGKSFINELVFADDANRLTKTAVHPLAFENAEVGKLAIPDHMYDRFKDAIDKIQ